jgi:hypothetical protein
MMDMPKEIFDSESSDKLDSVAERYETQSDKLKQAARGLECDPDEAKWEDKLRKVVKQKPLPEKSGRKA